MINGLHVPSDETTKRILWETTKFVLKDGDLVETLLKKQLEDNTYFQFLFTHNEYHPLYIFLKNIGKDGWFTREVNILSKKVEQVKTPPLNELNNAPVIFPQPFSSLVQAPPVEIIVPLIIPPEEIKAVIEKVIRFTLINGEPFEKKMKEQATTVPSYNFLLPWNEYHEYYLQQKQAALVVSEKLNSQKEQATQQRVETLKIESNSVMEVEEKVSIEIEEEPKTKEDQKAERLKRVKKMMKLLETETNK